MGLNAWLLPDNTERPHRGYRMHGNRPIDAVNDYDTTARQRFTIQALEGASWWFPLAARASREQRFARY